jgi:flagellar FliL protein
MAAKNDAKETKEAAPGPDKAAPPAAADAATEAPAGSSVASLLKAWLPATLAIVLAPAASFAVSEFVLLPRLQKKLAEPTAAARADNAAPAGESGEGKHGKEGKGEGKEGGANYEFTNVVVNLAGTMGTRYLKTSFIVTGAADTAVKPVFEANKAKLTDITLNVLSSLTLSDLEEPGSKNVLREKLVAAYNQALGKRVAEQVYFSDFVVQ